MGEKHHPICLSSENQHGAARQHGLSDRCFFPDLSDLTDPSLRAGEAEAIRAGLNLEDGKYAENWVDYNDLTTTEPHR